MYPTVTLLGHNISSYALLSLLGIAVTSIVLIIVNYKRDILLDQLIHILLAAIAGVIIGAHLLYGITQLPNMFDVIIHQSDRISTIKDVFGLLSQGFGGMVFYGGLLGGLSAVYLYCKYLKLDTHIYGNAIIPGIPLFHMFGRIGCFLSGCCFGIECDFGFTYTHGLEEDANNIQRFPVQLLEASLELILCISLFFLLIKYNNKYSLVRIYLICYSIIRFLDEFLRGDNIRGFWGPFSTSQWISLFIMLTLLIEYSIKRKNRLSR